LKKPYDKLTYGEKIELIYERYMKKQRITYEEYVLILMTTNDELWFCYDDTVYQVDYGIPGITAMYITKFNRKQKISERSENYSSVIDMLDKFKIEGKTIKEIWDDITFELLS
jgi:hypothetical protein